MALSPQRIRDTHFKPARRGYDQGEVDSFVEEVASALESAQNDATAMEARARAAVARLQELSQQPESAGVEPAPIAPSVDEAETISRTLLLAQRTADTTIAEATAEADRVLAAAREEAAGHLDTARGDAGVLLEEARVEARRAGEAERVQVEGEVQALLARRDFLESDVDHLEQYLVAQRERIAEAVASLGDLVARVPGGLADMRRPLLSAAADSGSDDEVDTDVDVVDENVDVDDGDDGDDEDDDPFVIAGDELPSDEHSEITEITRVAEADAPSGRDATPASSANPLFGDDGEPTGPIGVVEPHPR